MIENLLSYAIGGLVAFIVLWIGASILWNKKWRPMQISKGSPTPTFNELTKRIVKFIFKEDSEPYKRIPVLNRKWMYLILLAIGIILMVIGNPVPGGIVLFALFFIIFARTRGVFAQRNAALTRMYDVASSEFRYPRGTELNPWAMIQIQDWDELAIPGKTIVVFPAAYRSDDPKKRQDFENHFNATLGENNTWSYEWDSAKGIVTCTPVSHIPELAKYPGSTNHAWHEIPMGIGVSGEVVWDVSVAPHALVCGTTGGGKSVAQRSIVFHCIQHADKWRFLGIDLKRVELSGYKKYDEVVMGIATSVEDAVEVVRFVYDEMMDRYTEMENQGQSHFNDLPNPPKALMLMVDEAYALMAPSGGKSDDAKVEDELKAEAAHLIGQVARLGRAAGVHMILATQRPDAKVIFGELKQNLAFRYGAGRMDSIASNMVLDSDAGTRTPGGVKGRAAISVFGSESYLQGYFAKQDWIDEWLAKNRPDGYTAVPNDGMRAELPSDFSDGEMDENYSQPREANPEDMPTPFAQGKSAPWETDNQEVPDEAPVAQQPSFEDPFAEGFEQSPDIDEYESAFGQQNSPSSSVNGERRPQLLGKKDSGTREEDNWDDGMESIFQHVDNMEHQPVPEDKKPQRLSQTAPMNPTPAPAPRPSTPQPQQPRRQASPPPAAAPAEVSSPKKALPPRPGGLPPRPKK